MLAFRDKARPVFPDPSNIWKRTDIGGERVLERYILSDLEYRVRHVPNEQDRTTELDRLQANWRYGPDTVLPPRPRYAQNDSVPFEDRWHLVTEVRPYLVPLPLAPTWDDPDRRPEPGQDPAPPWATSEMQLPRPYAKYPEKFKSLIQISDGPGAIEHLRRRLFDIVSADDAMRSEVQDALGV